MHFFPCYFCYSFIRFLAHCNLHIRNMCFFLVFVGCFIMNIICVYKWKHLWLSQNMLRQHSCWLHWNSRIYFLVSCVSHSFHTFTNTNANMQCSVIFRIFTKRLKYLINEFLHLNSIHWKRVDSKSPRECFDNVIKEKYKNLNYFFLNSHKVEKKNKIKSFGHSHFALKKEINKWNENEK